jgi:hypothetical protein
MRYAPMLLLALAVAVAGCASANGGNGAENPNRRPNLLTQEDIRGTRHTNLYDAVATLRPNWLRTRGQISIGDPEAGQVVVYLNNIRAGGADYLRQVSAPEVVSLQYFDEVEASARFGVKQDGGAAIVIHTVRRR